jgi:hypothetical protein
MPLTHQDERSATNKALAWLHFGDLHITSDEQQNYRDLLALIDDANKHLRGAIDFAVLPGDNADDGTRDQYRLIRRAIDRLQIPLQVIAGDHDVKTGSLDPFREGLGYDLPGGATIGGYRCLFLHSAVFHDRGVFGLGDEQEAWLSRELEAASSAGLRPVLFMHAYPSEHGRSSALLAELIRRHHVLFVDMGHTHYNEIANDGRTIYAATRSTGQIEEGPVGFSLTILDRDVVSWKFKPLGAWPFVMITSPADQHFIVEPERPDQVVRGVVEVRARTWDDQEIVSATCEIDGDSPRAMTQAGPGAVWRCLWDSTDRADGAHRIAVRVINASGMVADDSVTVLIDQAGRYTPPVREPGDSVNAVGAWAEKGVLGTQLGPNKNGRRW